MKLYINEKNKAIMLWCYNNENPNTNVPTSIENIINQYKQKKYRVCVFQSGEEDIKKNLLQLIENNSN